MNDVEAEHLKYVKSNINRILHKYRSGQITEDEAIGEISCYRILYPARSPLDRITFPSGRSI